MKAIEQAVTLRARQELSGVKPGDTAALITAFLDAILADPEAMERIEWDDDLTPREIIEALKQEAER